MAFDGGTAVDADADGGGSRREDDVPVILLPGAARAPEGLPTTLYRLFGVPTPPPVVAVAGGLVLVVAPLGETIPAVAVFWLLTPELTFTLDEAPLS